MTNRQKLDNAITHLTNVTGKSFSHRDYFPTGTVIVQYDGPNNRIENRISLPMSLPECITFVNGMVAGFRVSQGQ